MIFETASQRSPSVAAGRLLKAAGLASIKRLAKTPPGRQVLRVAYDGHFESAGGYQRLFRGLYPDFASAVADAPPGKQIGYNGDATATRSAHERHVTFPSDYPVMFWLNRILPEARLLFDLGGNVGNRYLAFRKYLAYPENFIWLVNDIPAVVALGPIIAQEEAATHLQFTTDLARLPEADILLASGVLQVLDDWNGFLERAASLPRHILINRTSVGDQTHMVTLCATGVSFNPYHIFNRQSFVAAFVDLGYRLIDEWQVPDLSCKIPGHTAYSLDAFSGFYFILDGPRARKGADAVNDWALPS